MRSIRRALALAAATALAALPLLPASAGATRSHAGPAGSVYVLSNQTAGNAVIEYHRTEHGNLLAGDSYATGGTGTSGGLGSQGAVIVDDSGRFLYAVNAGSNSITSFRIGRDGLERLGTVDSGGTTPTSLTAHGRLVYVLNAGSTGNITGFRAHHGHLTMLAGSTRPLSGSATAPAQVEFAPDGKHLVVTERATNKIDVFEVDGRGLAASSPLVEDSAGATPFGFEFTERGHLVVSEAFGGAADVSSVSSYALARDGGLHVISASVSTTETAACWIAITDDGRFAYAGNAGSNSISGYRVNRDGSLALIDADGKTGSALAGVTDLALSDGSEFLYARLGNGSVGGYEVLDDGSLVALAPIGGLPTGAAGIAAT